MRTAGGWTGLCVGLGLVLAATAVGCGGDDDSGPPDDGGISDGAADDAGDGSVAADTGVDGSDEDAQVPVDAGVDASASDAGDAAVDAGPDNTYFYGKGSLVGPESQLGRSLAIDGDTIVVGAPGDLGGGAAYVFVREGEEWVEQARLVAEHRDDNDQFGYSVAIDGDTIVVGAPEEGSNATGVDGDATDNSLGTAGAAYVFSRDDNGDWSLTAYLKASNTGAGDRFGYAVAVSDATIAVSAHTEASGATGVDGNQTDNSVSFSGAVYVFAFEGTAWAQQAYVKASNTGQFDRFGVSLDLDGDTLVVGAYLEDSLAPGINGDQSSNLLSDSGAAYVFVRNAGVWSQQAFVKASNCGAADRFGYSVSVDGDVLVVGARYEDGLPGNPIDDGNGDSGAAYVFVRDGVTWSELAYLKPTISDPGDGFGTMVAAFGDTIAVGAMDEDSATAFPDVDPTNNDAESAGAVYLFTLSETEVTEREYLKAWNPGAGDNFGQSIGVTMDRLAVGAFSERGPGDNAQNEGAFYIYNR